MYETEIKVEVSESQLQGLLVTFSEFGFVELGTIPQEDLYVEAVASPYGAYDVKRYRSEGPCFYYTEKVWEVENGAPVRREIEQEVTKEDFENAKASFPSAVKIAKSRQYFSAHFRDRDISVSVDSVKFDHSENVRHFLEVEILVLNKSLVPEIKTFLLEFVAYLLGIASSEVVEAKGMFTMAFEKL